MNWIFIAITSGMLMTSSHETEEGCLGRKAMLEKEKITHSKCVDMRVSYYTSSGTIALCKGSIATNGICIQ